MGRVGRVLLGQFVEAGIDVHVDAADEEAGDGGDHVDGFAGGQAVLDGEHESLFDFGVTLEAKDQGHVDVDAVSQ